MPSISHACAACAAPLQQVIADLGKTPLANSYLKPEQLNKPEPSYPLCAYVCNACWLVQVPPVVKAADIFSNYAYFSSFSDTWRAHCAAYAKTMIARLKLGANSRVIEIASNDGILLQQFKEAAIPVLGIEPAENIAAYANQRGISTRALFFGQKTAETLVNEGFAADLIAANNVLAHVPDLHDFIAGFATLLKPSGTITFEFPHLLQLLRHTQFDTIYHEHYSYLSLTALAPLFAKHGLTMVDVETLPTHGGSLRLFVTHKASAAQPTKALETLLREEEAYGLKTPAIYAEFDQKVRALKNQLLATLQRLQAEGKRIAAYGAPAKGNTLLNYCGIDRKFVAYTVDRNPEKQQTLLPGSHLPVYAPEHLLQDKPDIVLILPWNIAPEIMRQMAAIRDWGGQFLIPVPNVELA